MSAARIPLGRMKKFKPANVAAIKPYDVIMLVRRFARENPEWFQTIRDRVDYEIGAPRQLSVETLIGAGIAVGDSGVLFVRQIAALMRALDVGEQRVLGLRWVDPNRGGEKIISERQVAHLFGEIAAAFNNQKHDHAVIQGEFVLAAGGTGEILSEVCDVDKDDLVDYKCHPQCRAYMTMERMGNILLAALHRHLGIPESDRYALDSYLLPTHFATLSWGAKADIDPAWVSDEAKKNVVANQAITLHKKGTNWKSASKKGTPPINHKDHFERTSRTSSGRRHSSKDRI